MGCSFGFSYRSPSRGPPRLASAPRSSRPQLLHFAGFTPCEAEAECREARLGLSGEGPTGGPVALVGPLPAQKRGKFGNTPQKNEVEQTRLRVSWWLFFSPVPPKNKGKQHAQRKNFKHKKKRLISWGWSKWLWGRFPSSRVSEPPRGYRGRAKKRVIHEAGVPSGLPRQKICPKHVSVSLFPQNGSGFEQNQKISASFCGYHLIIVVGYHPYFDTFPLTCLHTFAARRTADSFRRTSASRGSGRRAGAGAVPARAASSEDPVAFFFGKGFPLNATGKKRLVFPMATGHLSEWRPFF